MIFILQRREREIQQQLEQQEESAINVQETYTSLQQEVEIKTKKLKKVISGNLGMALKKNVSTGNSLVV